MRKLVLFYSFFYVFTVQYFVPVYYWSKFSQNSRFCHCLQTSGLDPSVHTTCIIESIWYLDWFPMHVFIEDIRGCVDSPQLCSYIASTMKSAGTTWLQAILEQLRVCFCLRTDQGIKRLFMKNENSLTLNTHSEHGLQMSKSN